MVTQVTLVSPAGGGMIDLAEHFDLDDGWYYYVTAIPLTHSFIGDSQIFEFAFNINMSGGAQWVAEVRIYNNPPEILPEVADEFVDPFNSTVVIDLTPYESDAEDFAEGLSWMASGYNPACFTIDIDAFTDEMTVTPTGACNETVNLRLTDLDGAFDVFDVHVHWTAGAGNNTNVTYQCSDGIDNDLDGFIDMEDPGCTSIFDDNESDGGINGTNILPEAILVVDPTSGDAPLVVTIDGSMSFDPDGYIVSYYYTFGDGDWTTMLPGEPMPIVYTYDADGNYTVTLVVVDDMGGMDFAADVVVVGEDINENLTECSDGIDNDGDGLIDMEDPDCTSEDDNTESGTSGPGPFTVYACSDGIDNDGDGKIDLQDPGCSDALDNSEYDVDGKSTWAPRPKMTDELTVNRIDIRSDNWQPDIAYAGEELFMEVALENGLGYDLDDMKITIRVEELGLRKSRNVDVDAGDMERFKVVFNIPYDALPGIYDVLVEASNDDVRRVKYREFTVIE